MREEDITEQELERRKVNREVFNFHILFERKGFVGESKRFYPSSNSGIGDKKFGKNLERQNSKLTEESAQSLR